MFPASCPGHAAGKSPKPVPHMGVPATPRNSLFPPPRQRRAQKFRNLFRSGALTEVDQTAGQAPARPRQEGKEMKTIMLWLIGVPVPVIILLYFMGWY